MKKNTIGMFANMTKDKSDSKIKTPEPKNSVTSNNEEIIEKFSNQAVPESKKTVEHPTERKTTVKRNSKSKAIAESNPLANEKKSLGIKADVWVKVVALQPFVTNGNINDLLDELIEERYDSLSKDDKKRFDDNVKSMSDIELQKIKLKRKQ